MTSIRCCAVLAFACGWGLPQTAAAEERAVPASRPFHLGFTRWPADLTAEGIQQAQDFAHTHGDIVSVMFIGGIPWTEALDGKPFSRDVQANLGYRPPPGVKLFLSISPLDRDRKNLAPYWGEKDNHPLPLRVRHQFRDNRLRKALCEAPTAGG